MSHRISDSRAIRRNGQLVVAMLALTAAAIMIGAALATRYQFPRLSRFLSRQPTQSLSPFTTSLRDLPTSNGVKQIAQTANSRGRTQTAGQSGKQPGGTVAQGQSSPGNGPGNGPGEAPLTADEAGISADRAYATGTGNAPQPISPFW